MIFEKSVLEILKQVNQNWADLELESNKEIKISSFLPSQDYFEDL